jgi:hypothetical protein
LIKADICAIWWIVKSIYMRVLIKRHLLILLFLFLYFYVEPSVDRSSLFKLFIFRFCWLIILVTFILSLVHHLVLNFILSWPLTFVIVFLLLVCEFFPLSICIIYAWRTWTTLAILILKGYYFSIKIERQLCRYRVLSWLLFFFRSLIIYKYNIIYI